MNNEGRTMYSAVIRAGKVEIREKSGKRSKKKTAIGAPQSGVEAIAVDLDGDQATINWNDGSASVHSLPAGDEIRRLR
jgi:hypothetical protein